MYIQIPVTTEVIERNADICTKGKFEEGQIVIEMDTRKRDYKTTATGAPLRPAGYPQR